MGGDGRSLRHLTPRRARAPLFCVPRMLRYPIAEARAGADIVAARAEEGMTLMAFARRRQRIGNPRRLAWRLPKFVQRSRNE